VPFHLVNTGVTDFQGLAMAAIEIILPTTTTRVGQDSAVGIATRYGLDGPGIETRWGWRDFPHPSRPALGPTQPPV